MACLMFSVDSLYLYSFDYIFGEKENNFEVISLSLRIFLFSRKCDKYFCFCFYFPWNIKWKVKYS